MYPDGLGVETAKGVVFKTPPKTPPKTPTETPTHKKHFSLDDLLATFPQVGEAQRRGEGVGRVSLFTGRDDSFPYEAMGIIKSRFLDELRKSYTVETVLVPYSEGEEDHIYSFLKVSPGHGLEVHGWNEVLLTSDRFTIAGFWLDGGIGVKGTDQGEVDTVYSILQRIVSSTNGDELVTAVKDTQREYYSRYFKTGKGTPVSTNGSAGAAQGIVGRVMTALRHLT